MGKDIWSEITKVIDNLTTRAITKIDNHMTTQFDTMSTNVSTIIILQHSTITTHRTHHKASTIISPLMSLELKTLHQHNYHKYLIIRIPLSHGKTETEPDGFR
eukprot:4405853-Ditylum_brightwellii.AAC.1